MQTYAVVDSEFRFVKIGRTGDLESRMATLNTASPRPLILMALFDGDIESDMHRMLHKHRERLEWFRYNTDVETTIVSRMTPTWAWFGARKAERRRREKSYDPDQMPPVDVSLLSREQRDGLGKAHGLGLDRFGALFGIPTEEALDAVVRRAHGPELCATRRTLTECKEKVRSEIGAAKEAGAYERLKIALFALKLIKNWRNRIGLELGAVHAERHRNSLS